MLENYIPIFIVFTFAMVFALLTVFSSEIIGPKRPTKEKLSPYESGMKPIGTAEERVSIKYYLVAMLFIIFDLEVIFIYPWAVKFKELYHGSAVSPAIGLPAFVSMLIFLVVFELGFLYAYKKGAFRWD